MANVPSGKMARIDWLKEIFAGGLKHVILQRMQKKLREQTAKRKKITKQKTMCECESKENHSESEFYCSNENFKGFIFNDEN